MPDRIDNEFARIAEFIAYLLHYLFLPINFEDGKTQMHWYRYKNNFTNYIAD